MDIPLQINFRNMDPSAAVEAKARERAAKLENYVHRNSILRQGFDKLEVGEEVRLVVVEAESAQGPQATTVKPIGKHHTVNPLP